MRIGQAILPALAAPGVAACLWRGDSVTLLGFTCAVLILALCIWLVAGVISAAVALHNMRIVTRGSVLRLFLSGHLWRLIVALPLALWSAVWIAVSIIADPWRTLAGAALIAGLVPGVALASRGLFGSHVIAEQRLRVTLPFAIAVAGALALGASLLLPNAPPASLAEGVARAVRYTGPSALLGQVFDLYAVSAGVTDLWRGTGWRSLFLGLLIEGSLWFGLASALALLLVPVRDLARVLRPGGGVGVIGWALAGAALAAVALVLFEGVARFEDRVRIEARVQVDTLAVPGPGAGSGAVVAPLPDLAPETGMPPALLPSAIRERIEREQIGDLLCPPGTAEWIAAARARAQAVVAMHEGDITAAAQAGFDRMRAGVPGFLDAYYSLTAEYLRTLNLLTGNAEGHLQGILAEHLDSAAAFGALQEALTGLETTRATLLAMQEEERARLAGCDSVLPRDDGEAVITLVLPATAPGLPLPPEGAAFERRLATAGFAGIAGGIGGAVIGSVGAKLVLAPLFKTAASALVKLAGGRLAAALAGAGTGALAGGGAGSVIPGAGTAVGAFVGGAIGFIGAWIGTDYLLLRLDEAVSRADFEAEILSAIDATEAEFIAALTGVR
ncbi:MAG: hypothetical protein IT542_06330 [Rubellimicrobium sp.]|nr:hypothetical protein [Rubellimicrobium sp.]